MVETRRQRNRAKSVESSDGQADDDSSPVLVATAVVEPGTTPTRKSARKSSRTNRFRSQEDKNDDAIPTDTSTRKKESQDRGVEETTSNNKRQSRSLGSSKEVAKSQDSKTEDTPKGVGTRGKRRNKSLGSTEDTSHSKPKSRAKSTKSRKNDTAAQAEEESTRSTEIGNLSDVEDCTGTKKVDAASLDSIPIENEIEASQGHLDNSTHHEETARQGETNKCGNTQETMHPETSVEINQQHCDIDNKLDSKGRMEKERAEHPVEIVVDNKGDGAPVEADIDRRMEGDGLNIAQVASQKEVSEKKSNQDKEIRATSTKELFGDEASVSDKSHKHETKGKPFPVQLKEGPTHQRTENAANDKKIAGKSPPDTEQVESKTNLKTLATSAKHRRRRHRSKDKPSSPRNELTHIIPGYTAPMRLTTALSQTESSSGLSSSALEGLRRKAMREDAANIKQNVNARIMAQRSATGNLSALYQESHASFHKKGKTRLAASSSSVQTAGEGWFHMRATPMTEEVEHDLALIRNRNYLDPKRFYKSADKKRGGQAILQAGTVIEGPTEFLSSRLSKKQRRSNLVDEVLTDRESSRWALQKFKTMQQEKGAAARKWSKTVPKPGEFRKNKAK